MGDDLPRDDTPLDGADAPRPLDLSALRVGGRSAATPAVPDRWEALARRIEAAAAPELARRAARARRNGGAPAVLFAIARAARPALLALAASAVFALALARSTGTTSTTAPVESSLGQVAEVSIAKALRVDEPAESWLIQQRAPSADDLARAIDPAGTQ